MDNLNEKTRGLLLRERREFLAAYRAHTYKIQNELKDLRRRVAEEQSRTARKECCGCTWYRSTTGVDGWTSIHSSADG